MKKLLSYILCAAILFSLAAGISPSVFAASVGGECGESLTWSLDRSTGRLSILGTGEMFGYRSANLIPWYTYRREIKSVDVTSGVTYISGDVFNGISGLQYNVYDDGYYLGNESDPYVIFVKPKNERLTSCVLHEDTKIIYNWAFGDCMKLSSITLPDGLCQIGDSVFGNCPKLLSIDLPESLLYIGNNAFGGCLKLASIVLPKNLKSVGSGAFRFCALLDELIIPDGVEEIGDNTFCDCTGLEFVTLPGSVRSIGASAFSGCTKLKDIFFGGSEAEWNALTVAADTAEFLGGVAVHFDSICGDTLRWYIADGVLNVLGTGEMYDYSVPQSAPWYPCRDSVSSVRVASGATSIGSGAFRGFEFLETVSFGSDIAFVGENAFSGCTSLSYAEYIGTREMWEATEVASGNESILNADRRFVYRGVCGTDAEWVYDTEDHLLTVSGTGDMTDYSYSTAAPWSDYRQEIESFTVEDGITSIGYNTISSLPALKHVSVPDTVTSIGDYNFNGCGSLAYENYGGANYLGNSGNPYIILVSGEEGVSNCTVNSGARFIYSGAFTDSIRLRSVTIPDGVISVGNSAFSNCTKLTSLSIPKSVTSIGRGIISSSNAVTSITVDPDNAVYFSSGNCIIERDGGVLVTGCTNSTIPDGVTAIGDLAFRSLSRIETLEIPESVTSVGESAFNNCRALQSLELPGGVTSIGESAFESCTALTRFEIPSGVSKIEGQVFRGCTALESVTLHRGLESIGANAFNSCNSLTSIYYLGTEEEFRAITVDNTGAGNFKFINSNVYFESSNSGSCGDGAVWNFDPDTEVLSILGAGAIYDYSETQTPWNAVSDIIKQITVDEGITDISAGAFENLFSLESVSLPVTLESVGKSAFSGCSVLSDVYFGGTDAEWAAISIADGNDALTSADLHCSYSGTVGRFKWSLDSAGILTVTGSGALQDFTEGGAPWYGLRDLIVGINIGSGINSIGEMAFAGCAVAAALTLPESVQTVGAGAFSGCTSLTDVFYTGSLEGFGRIEKSGWNTDGLNIHPAYCLDISEIYSFSNAKTNFGTKYRVSDEDFKKLCDYVRILYKDEPKNAQSVINTLQSARSRDWSGSCYGMALTTVLDYYDQIGFNENFDPDAVTMHDVSAPNTNEAVESAINYYHISQNISYIRHGNDESYRIGKDDWGTGLSRLIEASQHGIPLLFCYQHDSSAHAIVIKGYRQADDGSHELVAYDNRYPSRDVIVKIDKNLTTCVINGKEVASYIEFVENPSVFDMIDIDGPDNDYANFRLDYDSGGGGGGADDGNAEITIKSSGKVTLTNAEGKTVVFENGEYHGTMEIESEYLTLEDGEDDSFTFTYTVENSASFTFVPESEDLFVSVLSTDVYASADTLGATSVVISKDDGVSSSGEAYTYLLTLSVNNGICDMISIDGTSGGTTSLSNKNGVIKAIGIDSGNGGVSVYSNTVNYDRYSYAHGYTSLVIVPNSSEAGDVSIMGSSQEDGNYDVNIGVPEGKCEHEWGCMIEKLAPTYRKNGMTSYTCTKCGIKRLDLVPKLVSKIRGDATGDGEINMKDILLARRILAGLDTADESVAVRLDANADGEFDMKAVLKLRRIVAGLEQ